MGFILNQEVPDPSAFEIQPPQNTNINLFAKLLHGGQDPQS